MGIERQDCGSAHSGPLAKGCEYCIRGSKMVLFVTGKCRTGCYYCPVSFEKKGRDVVAFSFYVNTHSHEPHFLEQVLNGRTG